MREKLTAAEQKRFEELEAGIKEWIDKVVVLPDDEFKVQFDGLIKMVPEMKAPLEKQRAFFKSVQGKPSHN